MTIGKVKTAPMTFGSAGTQTSITAGTGTSNQVAGPRDPYTVQVTGVTTGTSGVGGAVVLQGSNDGVSWVAISSATATASQASTSTSVGGAAIAVSGSAFASIRATLTITGTGLAFMTMGM